MPRQKYHLPHKITFTQADGTQNVFIRGEVLGSGSFSIVYRVTHQNTNKIYAMKVISKKKYLKSKTLLLDLENEIKIQKLVNHPNVVSLDYSFSDDDNHYFALEYCPGGTVREYLHKNKHYRLDEPEIRKIIKDLIQGLVYIHSLRIIHHDIKLENLVIDSKGNVKIGDFGLSNFQKNENDKKNSIFGTLKYLSPEMLHRGNRVESYKMDIWAVGISAFFLLTGRHPFEGETREKIVKNIKKGLFQFPLNFQISNEVKDFIRAALQKDPEKRPSAKELLNHHFLRKSDKVTVCLYKQNCLPPLIKAKAENLKEDLGQKNDNLKQPLCPPLSDARPVSQRQQNGNLKLTLCPPLNDNKNVSPRRQNDNLKPPLCPPLSVARPISQRQQFVNQKPTFCPPQNDNKIVSPRKQNVNLKPTFCSPLSDNKNASPRRQNDNMKSPLCPPLNSARPVSQRQYNVNPKPPLCPPLNDNNHISLRRQNDNFKSPLCPPLSDSRPVSQRQQNVNQKPALSPPLSDINHVSPILPGSNLKQAYSPPKIDLAFSIFAYNSDQCEVKSFFIPSYFVSRFCFYNGDLGYLLYDGTVGICFKDDSRIVMDPNERFAQFYKDSNTEFPDIILLNTIKEKNQPEIISLMKKVAKNFKKIRFSYDLENIGYDPGVILHNINCFVKKDDTILFKLDGMNFQVNFNDRVKLIIFWEIKKMCFFSSFREKCTFLDLKNLNSMNHDSDGFKKFEQAKILLSDLSITIC